MSLARALSKLGVCSRKEAERWIEAGRVAIGARACREPRVRVDLDRDEILLDGRRVTEPKLRLVVALNKPVGAITTRADPRGRPTVYDLIATLGEWVFPVGRLDSDTSGLLILTNDHCLGQALTDPERHVPKVYHARVRGIPERWAIETLRQGVTLDDWTTRPARVRLLGTLADGSSWMELTLIEGKNRQVRRMCAAVGHEVLDLTRVMIGRLALGELPVGAWRRLGPPEVELLGWRRD